MSKIFLNVFFEKILIKCAQEYTNSHKIPSKLCLLHQKNYLPKNEPHLWQMRQTLAKWHPACAEGHRVLRYNQYETSHSLSCSSSQNFSPFLTNDALLSVFAEDWSIMMELCGMYSAQNSNIVISIFLNCLKIPILLLSRGIKWSVFNMNDLWEH